MTKRTNSSWQKQSLFAAIATVVFMFAANSLTFAQTNYKVGDKVEINNAGQWDKAEIIEAKDGKFKIHYEGYSSVHDVWVEPKYMRRIGGNVPTSNENNAGSSQPQKQTSATNTATKYKPGDRVECDKGQIGVWEKGTVVPFLPNDIDKESGRYYRVRLDSFKKSGLYAAGHECMVDAIRPLNEAPLKASGKYKVGDAVEAKNSNGSWLPAKIIAVAGAFYKVRFDNRDSRHDETVSDERIRPLGTSEQEAEDQNKQNETRNLTPKMAGAFPSLPGTAWQIDFGKGVTGTVFQFCKNRTWEIVPDRIGSIGAVGKSYSVSGSTLTTVNADDGMVEKWKMTWKGGILELFDGKTTLRLHYAGENQC